MPTLGGDLALAFDETRQFGATLHQHLHLAIVWVWRSIIRHSMPGIKPWRDLRTAKGLVCRTELTALLSFRPPWGGSVFPSDAAIGP